MKKRLVSIILTVFLVLSMMPFAAFADNAIVCPACGGFVTKQERRLLTAHDDFYKCDKCGKWAWVNKLGSLSLFSVGDQQILDAADSSAIINFSFNNGHLIPAEKAPTGIGRKDLPGYASDDGTPSVSSDGGIIWQPTWDDVVQKNLQLNTGDMAFFTYDFSTSDISHYYTYFDLTYKKGVSDAIITLSASSKADSEWSTPISKLSFYGLNVTAPIKGKYFRLESPGLYNSALDEMGCYSSSNSSSFYDSGVSLPSFNVSKSSANCVYVRNCYWHIWLPKYKIIPYNSADKPTSQTNITINKNTWNGNIYVDNSTNLTYIYPQYTTINENNETVTNISNNPIIYNNETNKYYTYDSVTNNYYYINNYEDTPTPTPSPSPSPTPSPSPSPSPDPTETPAPDVTPTPTDPPTPTTPPTPGGDNPGGSGSGSGSGDNSWNPFKWLADLLKDIVEKILKAIWKLITSIFSFLLWLLSLVGKLFPFIPTQAITAITAGAVIVTVIRIIKFITGR